MKTPSNDGGPAFPAPMNGPDGRTQHGMTLRDYFAAQALAGIDNDFSAQGRAIWAYECADAMLAARERKEDAP